MAVRSTQHTSVRNSRAVYPRTRRIRFRFNEEAGRKYFVAGDMVFSHFVAINAVVSHLEGQDQVIVFRPDHTSRTTLRLDGDALKLVERGPEAVTGVL